MGQRPRPGPDLVDTVEIDLAIARGDVALSTWRGYRVGHFSSCPWAPIYEVLRPVTIAGRMLQPLQQFTYDVSAEGVAHGRAFRRELLVGPFHSNAGPVGR